MGKILMATRNIFELKLYKLSIVNEKRFRKFWYDNWSVYIADNGEHFHISSKINQIDGIFNIFDCKPISYFTNKKFTNSQLKEIKEIYMDNEIKQWLVDTWNKNKPDDKLKLENNIITRI